MNDRQRAGIIAVVQSAFPVLVILGIANLTDVEIAAVMLFVSNTLTLVMLLWKDGQQPAKLPVVQVSIPEDRELVYRHPDPKGGTCISWVPKIWDGSPTRCHCGALELVGETP